MNENKFNCPFCGSENSSLNKFCIKCGNSILSNNTNTSPNLNAFFPQNENNNYNNNQNMNNSVSNSINQVVENTQEKVSLGMYFSILVAGILKPKTTISEEVSKFKNIKNSLILSLIISLIGAICLLISNIISVVRVTNILNDKTTWVWDNLKEFNYIKTFGTNFLIVIGIIMAITCVYYIGSLIVKKNSNFSQMLFIVTIALTPFLFIYCLGSPLVNLINIKWGIILSLIGGVYSFVIFYENINDHIGLDSNNKVYFNFICLAILLLIGYYLYGRFMVSTVTDGLDYLNDLKDWLN